MSRFHATSHDGNECMSYSWRKLISREGVDITTVCELDIVFYACIRQLNQKIREPFFTFFKDRILTHYLCVDPLAVGRKIYPYYFRNPAQVKRYYREGLKFLAQVKRSVARWQHFLESHDYKWQYDAFREFRQQFTHVNHEFSIWPWWGIESWQIDAEQMISRMIRRNALEARQEQIIASIYKPWRKTAIVRLQERLRNGDSIPHLIKEYQFLRSWSAVWYRPIDRKWITDFKLQANAGVKMEWLSLTEIVKLLRPDQKERWFLEITPYIIFFKDWRDDVRRAHVYAWSFLFDSIAERFGIERNNLGYFSPDEIEQALQTGKFPHKHVAWRKTHSCVITVQGTTLKIRVIDKKIQKYERIITAIQSKGLQTTMVQGLIAQPGRVRGIVRLVKTYHDIKKFMAGEVLVTNTTHPNYLPAMQKAAAFVTNEGGIVSHAAIVARELKKPCIVGTKVATKVFQDGDRVEVDATKGMVRKI